MTEATTAAALGRRPSPRPRPAGEPGRAQDQAPHLRVVPPQVTAPEVPTSDAAEGAPTETITAGQSGSPTVELPAVSDVDFRTRAATVWANTRTYWTPPQVFTDRPASLADLATYARHAPWTAQDTGPVRAFGIWYYRAFGYPYTVVSRYREWFVQRPLRFAALLSGVKLVASTGPGDWVVHTVIYPAAHLAGHIFL